MSQRVKILIGGSEVDYEDLSTVPLSISKSTDEILELVGTGGIEIDNSVKRLFVPSSKRGNEAFDQAHIPSSDTESAQASLPLQIIVDGEEVFAGECAIREVKILDGEAKGYGTEVFGGNEQLFGLLENVNLRVLPMGSVEYDSQTIQDSWDGSYDTGWSCLFAPVVYKGDNSTLLHTFDFSDFRPHLYYRSIIDGIADHLGYTVESTFFGTDFFKKHLYMFGVGDKWQKFSESPRFFSERTGPETPPVGNFGWVPVGQDPVSGFGSWSLTVTKDDAYDILVDVGLRWACDVRVVDQSGNVLGEFPAGVQNSEPLLIEAVPLLATNTVTVEFQRLSSGQSFLEGPLSLSVEAVPYPVLGGDIRLASAMHDNNVLDFIRGITHQFNLAWGVNNFNKTIFVEPRFDYRLNGTIYPGFYHHGVGRTENPAEDISDLISVEDITMRFERPFGDALVLGNKEEDSSLWQITEGRSADDVRYLSSHLPMVVNGEEEEVFENPYWEGMLTVGGGRFGCIDMPIIAPDYDLEDGFPEDDKDAFISEPKYGFYLGRYTPRRFNIGTDEYVGAPLVCQRPSDALPELMIPPTVACYPDYVRLGITYPGYVSTFYPKFMAILRKGLTLEAEQLLSAVSFQEEDFRSMKIIQVQGSSDSYYLMRIEDFRPLEGGLTKVQFLKDEPIKQSLFDLITHNGQDSGARL